MWYVIQVLTGEEEKMVLMCRKIIGIRECAEGILQKCFIPYAIRQRRYCGQWHAEQRVLFPGYVFLITNQPEKLFTKLESVPGLTKMLRTGQEIVPLSKEEEKFLEKMGGNNHIVENSIGMIEKDQIIITRGPLQGMEGYIRKIDRHKRVAWLGIQMMGRNMEVQVGLEVVEKRLLKEQLDD